jgi:hypothetical protein
MLSIPDPDIVLSELSPLWPSIYIALEWGTQKARTYFDAEEVTIDRNLAPNIVRFQAKRALARDGHEAHEEECEDYALRSLPNNGLSLSFRGDLLYHLRILKADGGQLPIPGASKVKQAFWNQQLVFDYDASSAEEALPSLNLLVLWETDVKYNLHKLFLACPKSGAMTRESVEAYWIVEIPHPSESTPNEPINPPDPDGPEDLDITLDLPDTATEESE